MSPDSSSYPSGSILAKRKACVASIKKYLEVLDHKDEEFGKELRKWVEEAESDDNLKNLDPLANVDTKLRAMVEETLSLLDERLKKMSDCKRIEKGVANKSAAGLKGHAEPLARQMSRTWSLSRLHSSYEGRATPLSRNPSIVLGQPQSRTTRVHPPIHAKISSSEATADPTMRTAVWMGSTSQSSDEMLRESKELVEQSLKWLRPMTDLLVATQERRIGIEHHLRETQESGRDNSRFSPQTNYSRAEMMIQESFPEAPRGLQARIARAMTLWVDDAVASTPEDDPSLAGTGYSQNSNRLGSADLSGSNNVARRKSVRGHEGASSESPLPGDPPRFRRKSKHRRQESFFCCVVEDCKEPRQLFESYVDWFQHTEKHRSNLNAHVWTCVDSSHGVDVCTFPSQELFEAHMWEEHDDSFDAEDLADLADMCREPAPSTTIFESEECPLCYEVAPGPRKKRPLLRHLVGHFEAVEKQCFKLLEEQRENHRRQKKRVPSTKTSEAERSLQKYMREIWKHAEFSDNDLHGVREYSRQYRHAIDTENSGFLTNTFITVSSECLHPDLLTVKELTELPRPVFWVWACDADWEPPQTASNDPLSADGDGYQGLLKVPYVCLQAWFYAARLEGTDMKAMWKKAQSHPQQLWVCNSKLEQEWGHDPYV